ncbi:hypothetical protein A6R68_19790 [Neotoma lepida]|uniref:Uncharacterized protein n=1 Tax=Neotoma lepida TaxID=56216 RepID=A0A1A6HGY4_NEOLE|nr:hypothetical protein A6R68_19790 [Neotoma lepida]
MGPHDVTVSKLTWSKGSCGAKDPDATKNPNGPVDSAGPSDDVTNVITGLGTRMSIIWTRVSQPADEEAGSEQGQTERQTDIRRDPRASHPSPHCTGLTLGPKQECQERAIIVGNPLPSVSSLPLGFRC